MRSYIQINIKNFLNETLCQNYSWKMFYIHVFKRVSLPQESNHYKYYPIWSIIYLTTVTIAHWDMFGLIWSNPIIYVLIDLKHKSISSTLLSALSVVSFAYLRLLIFLLEMLIPSWVFPARHFTWCTLHINYINRVTIYSLDILLSQFGTSLLFHVWF